MEETIEKAALKLGFDDGMSGEKMKIKNKSINKVDPEAKSEVLAKVASAIGSLYEKDLVKVVRVEEKVIA